MKVIKLIFYKLKSYISFLIALLGIFMGNMRLRGGYLRILRFLGRIGLKMFPSIYDTMDKFNEKYSSGERVKEKYREKENFRSFLKKAEKKEWTKDKILSEISITPEMENILTLPLDNIFDNLDRNKEVAIQFTGGCDSSLIAMLAAQYFNKVHMITFSHPFIEGVRRSKINAKKITSIFGTDKVIHKILDSTSVFNEFVFGNYLADFFRYRTFIIGIGCLACKLSFDISIIKYSLKHTISVVFDGADVSVKTQLSQGDRDILKLRNKLFKENNILFKHPAVKFKNNAYSMLQLGLELNEKNIMYAEQPECIGNQFLTEIYDRYYYLPKYGLELHSKNGLLWLKNKMPVCRAFIKDKEFAIRHSKGH